MKMLCDTFVRRFAILAAASLLSVTLLGCATSIDLNLVPGTFSKADVENRLGPPSQRIAGAGGSETLYYSRQPFGRKTFAMQFDASGKLGSMENILDSAHLAKVVVGKTTAPELRVLLGPPYRVDRMARQKWNSWEYWMEIDSIPMRVFIQLSDDDVVREVFKNEEISRDPGRLD